MIMRSALEKIAAIVQHYDHEKYWKMYEKFVIRKKLKSKEFGGCLE